MVPTALLIVPVNTISSWETEFNKWTGKLKPSVLLFNLQNYKPDSRGSVIDQWQHRGGVLVVSKDTFATCVKKHPTLQSPGPSIVVLDEAHLMLSNKKSVIYKALSGIQTKRRVLLTGSPFQNNALEYYRMIRFIRPDILDSTESAFEREFGKTISRRFSLLVFKVFANHTNAYLTPALPIDFLSDCLRQPYPSIRGCRLTLLPQKFRNVNSNHVS